MQANLQALQDEVLELREFKLRASEAAEDAKLQMGALSKQIISLQVDIAALNVITSI